MGEDIKCEKCGSLMKPLKSDITDENTIFVCIECGNKFHLFEPILRDNRKKIMEIEKSYLNLPIKNVSDVIKEDVEKRHWEITSDYVLRGGKHLRSNFILLSNEALGGNFDDALLTGAAMEMCENWLLIHDDIEDNSQSRRGDKTLHLKYGIELAINAGDSLHLIMWKILRDNEKLLGNEKTYKIMDEFYDMLFRTTVGQTAELLFMQKDLREVKEDDFYYIADGKTGFYSIAGPLILGSIIAGKDSEEVVNSFREFGIYLGRAFQITDDVLDLTSDFKGLKKQKANDIYEGKRTLMLIHLMKNANEEEKSKIISIMNKSRDEKTQEEVDYILNLMNKYGSISYSLSKAKEFTKKALNSLNSMDFITNKEAKNKLLLALDFIINREY